MNYDTFTLENYSECKWMYHNYTQQYGGVLQTKGWVTEIRHKQVHAMIVLIEGAKAE